MANDILIRPTASKIEFSGSAHSSIRLEVQDSGSVVFQGSSGSLFGITDSMSGSLFSVNDISGLQIMEVFSDDKITLGRYQSPIIINQSGSISGSLTSTASFGQVTVNGTALGASPITALNNATANELVTVGSTTTELDAESLLTWNGNVLGVGIASPSIVGGIHVKNPGSQNGVAVFESADAYVNIALKDLSLIHISEPTRPY